MDTLFLLDEIYVFILCIPRFAMSLLFIPFFSPQMLGGSVIRNAVLIAFAVFIYPIVATQLEGYDLDRLSMLKIMSQEIVIGLMYGFFISMPFILVNTLGGIVDLQRGAMMSQVFNPGLGASSTEMAVFMNTVFAYAFFSIGPFLLSVAVVLRSYNLVPMNIEGLMLTEEILTIFASAFQDALMAATTFVAPIIMIIFFVDFGLGLVNRFSPSLNVFMLSLPIKSWVAIAMTLVLLTSLMKNFDEYTRTNISNLEDVWRVLAKPK